MVFGPQTLHRLPQMLDQYQDQIEKPKKTKIKLVDISFPDIEKFDFCLNRELRALKHLFRLWKAAQNTVRFV